MDSLFCACPDYSNLWGTLTLITILPTVRACTDNNTGEELAMKIIHLRTKKKFLNGILGPRVDDRLVARQEGLLWKECSGHRNVLKLGVPKHITFD